MSNIINPNCLSLPQQVEKNTQDILKILASNLEELTGLQFIPSNLIYQDQKADISGKFIVIRDDTSAEIDGVVSIPILGENGIIVDGSEDNAKIRIALDQSDRQLFNFVQELVNRTTESDEIVFTSDLENFVSEKIKPFISYNVIYDKDSDDININKGYTSGIKPSDATGISIISDLSDLDFIEVFFHTNQNISNYTICGKVFVDLKNISNSGTYPYEGNTTTSGLYHGFVGAGGSTEDYDKMNCGVSADKQTIRLRNVRVTIPNVESRSFSNCTYYKIRGGKYGNSN